MSKSNFFKNSSVLVTGGNGAVGSDLVKKLLNQSAKVVVLDDFSQSSPKNLSIHKNLKIIKGNITDEKILKTTFSKKYDYIFHLAARFANELSIQNPIEDLVVNIQGTLQILLHAAKQKPKRFVYTSSSSLYGTQKIISFKETLSPNPSTPYAASKLSAEHYCSAIGKLSGLNYTIVRLSNSYGPFDPPGKFRNVIPNFFDAAMHNKNIVITGTGKETRDFTFIDDTVKGIFLAATKKSSENQIFNLGTGKETQILKIAKIILDLTKSKSKIVFKPRRSFDPITRRKMDISKAKRLLGYFPETKIESGLQSTYDWFLNR
jgi:nucleoside-diphosphate-sugar epimerase